MKTLKILVLSSIVTFAHTQNLDPAQPETALLKDTSQENKNTVSDPLEIVNRPLFIIHQMFDEALIKPICAIYSAVMPSPIQQGVRNVVNNLFEPLSVINYTLQGRVDKAFKSLWRFGFNSTVGFLGVMDAATAVGVEGDVTGFSDTLASWGVPQGPYIIIPLLGPTTLRGVVGMTGDYFADPLNIYALHSKDSLYHKRRWLVYTRDGAYYLVKRTEVLESLDALKSSSLDYYSALKSVYNQKQQARLSRILDKN
ncbi:MAG TPA: VacJ family lipoprotein [Alphaproteobacteria bacterium]|nr:VacJ family lipoprotein [Alphaproteobacteria bacterium]